jgi:hypothetical protein
MSTELVVWEPDLEQMLQTIHKVQQCVKTVKHAVAQAFNTLARVIKNVSDAFRRIYREESTCTRSRSKTVRPCSYPKREAIASTRRRGHSRCGVNISAHYAHIHQDIGHPSARSHLR